MSSINTETQNISLETSDPKGNVKLEDTLISVGESFDVVSPLAANNITKKYLLDMLYLLSHIVCATILVVCLKQNNPMLLATILFAILGYICNEEQTIIPIYTLPAVGFLMYCFDLFIIGEPKTTIKKSQGLTTLNTTLWKLPYYGIMSYYVILYIMYCFKKDNMMLK